MLLAVDVGNSHTVLAVFAADRLAHHWRLRTERAATADEIGSHVAGLLLFAGLQPTAVQGLVVGSVVPPLRAVWLEVAARHLRCPALAVEPGLPTGLRLEVERPAEVGADRIADGLAAWRRHGAPAIVVDCGTATTVGAIAEGGRYLGGAIAPGFGTSYDSLVTGAALLQRVELATPAAALGRDTTAQMLSGLVFGFAGQVDSLVQRIALEMGGASHVIATGGWAGTLVPVSRTVTVADPWLTLHGLRLIFEACGGSADQDLPAGSCPTRPNLGPVSAPARQEGSS